MDVLISEKQLKERVATMALQLEEHVTKYDNDQPPVFICVLNGAYKFFTDLVSGYNGLCEIDFVKAKSYNGKDNSGGVEIKSDAEVDLFGKNLYIIDDIVDTGNTMKELIIHFNQKSPNRINVISLLKRKDNDHPIDLYGFEINDEWVVGYGLDDNGLNRNLNNIYEKGKTND
jgi:hypoxanthine phosphoribosyltransferase|tara:strand:- start:256 stop:774 length:519 start_codon:yes stop_codon:yes gene_type:complete